MKTYRFTITRRSSGDVVHSFTVVVSLDDYRELCLALSLLSEAFFFTATEVP